MVDDPSHFVPGSLLHSDDGRDLVVRAVRPYRDRGLLVAFEGITTRSAAERLRGTTVEVDAADLAGLEPGEWWTADLMGLEAVTPDGTALGKVVDVIAGSQDRLVVQTPTGEQVEVPFVDDLVDDPDGKTIVIRPPEGLFGPV